MKNLKIFFFTILLFFNAAGNDLTDKICGHKVLLDDQSKIMSWISPQSMAYGKYIDLLWTYILNKVSGSPDAALPMYYLYCGFRMKGDTLVPDTWMNDVGEKIPNWFESARLYYAYSGNKKVMDLMKKLMDYSLDHGITPSTYKWPNFPQTGANAGATRFEGAAGCNGLQKNDVQLDLAGDMGLSFFRMYQFTGEEKYKIAAINVADALSKNICAGSEIKSPWPFIVNVETGSIRSEYCANWFGCLSLFDQLINQNTGNVDGYKKVRSMARDWILKYPMKNGLWVDGHSDVFVADTSNLSNMSASNGALYILLHPDFDPDWRINIPRLLKWTEDHFIFNCPEPGIQWGAWVVAEQDTFKWKMGYQTSRYAAQCALWYSVSNDLEYKERAYRSLNWSTYMVDEEGKASDGPTETVGHWWSDCYGEGPRMFYYAFSAVPEWAPEGENHILYSSGIIKDVHYEPFGIRYFPAEQEGTEYLRLNFKPAEIKVDGQVLQLKKDQFTNGYSIRSLGKGDYSVVMKRDRGREITIK